MSRWKYVAQSEGMVSDWEGGIKIVGTDIEAWTDNEDFSDLVTVAYVEQRMNEDMRVINTFVTYFNEAVRLDKRVL